MRHSPSPKGFTLLELIIVVAIVATSLGLILSGVSRLRELALLNQSINNLRQIEFATVQYAGAHQGRLPPLNGDCWVRGNGNVFTSILPYLDQEPLYLYWSGSSESVPNKVVTLFLSPLEPAPISIPWDFLITGSPITNYACNAFAFDRGPSLNNFFADGLSNTVAFTEHYQTCGGVEFRYSCSNSSPRSSGGGRASFADGGPVNAGKNCGDFFPITTGSPPVSVALGAATFQVRPHPSECDPRLPNATSSSGLQIAMMDGSVHVLAPGTGPATFWGLVTPQGGELVSVDD